MPKSTKLNHREMAAAMLPPLRSDIMGPKSTPPAPAPIPTDTEIFRNQIDGLGRAQQVSQKRLDDLWKTVGELSDANDTLNANVGGVLSRHETDIKNIQGVVSKTVTAVNAQAKATAEASVAATAAVDAAAANTKTLSFLVNLLPVLFIAPFLGTLMVFFMLGTFNKHDTTVQPVQKTAVKNVK